MEMVDTASRCGDFLSVFVDVLVISDIKQISDYRLVLFCYIIFKKKTQLLLTKIYLHEQVVSFIKDKFCKFR